jgi:hypothetical protein
MREILPADLFTLKYLLIALCAGWIVYRIVSRILLGEHKTVRLELLEDVPKVTISLEELSRIWTIYNYTPDDEKKKKVEEIREKIREKLQTEGAYSPATSSTEEAPSGVGETEVSGEGGALPLLKSSALKTLWNEIIMPYIEEFENQQALPLVIKGFEILDNYGNVSSFSGKPEDQETTEITGYKDVLNRVSLVEHTINVVRLIVELVRKNYYNPEIYIVKAVIASLFHDIGKIEALVPDKITGTRVHALTSATLLQSYARELYGEKQPVWLDEVVQAVREHHIPTKHTLANILKRADQKARALEVSFYVKDLKMLDIDDWFDINEFKKDMFEKLNNDQLGKNWVGFTFNNVIYLRREGIYLLADEQRKRKKILSIEFLYEGAKKEAIDKIVKILIKEGLTVTEHGYGRYILARQDGKSYNTVFVALKGTIFSEEEMKTLELRKRVTQFASIVMVKPE